MNDCVYWGSANSGIYPAMKLLAYRAAPYDLGTLYSVKFMDGEAQRNYTALRFPRRAEDSKGQQIQQMNYNIFIRTMADLVQKYAPKMKV